MSQIRNDLINLSASYSGEVKHVFTRMKLERDSPKKKRVVLYAAKETWKREAEHSAGMMESKTAKQLVFLLPAGIAWQCLAIDGMRQEKGPVRDCDWRHRDPPRAPRASSVPFPPLNRNKAAGILALVRC